RSPTATSLTHVPLSIGTGVNDGARYAVTVPPGAPFVHASVQTTRSALPSPFRSAARRPVAPTVPETNDGGAKPFDAATARSGRPSPLKSPDASAIDPVVPLSVKIRVGAASEPSGCCVKRKSVSWLSSPRVSELRPVDQATSVRPSPLKSPVATPAESGPGPYVHGARNDGVAGASPAADAVSTVASTTIPRTQTFRMADPRRLG